MRREARAEQEIFQELEALCASPGYAHVIAHLCFRDNVVRFKGELTPEDAQHLYSRSRLIRTEISTLIGLMVRRPIDLTIPSQDVLSKLIKRTEQLLGELHDSMSVKMFNAAFDREHVESDAEAFSHGESMREPIFYGGESAYSFQYRDFAARKYSQDDEWLIATKGFSIGVAAKVIGATLELQNVKQEDALATQKRVPQRERTVLPGFVITTDEISKRSGVERELVDHVLKAFSLPENDTNTQFTALHAFNSINATPLLRIGPQEFILFQYYTLVEALYDSPFYWMVKDYAYASSALEHRGQFTEAFTYERLRSVFGNAHVYLNVSIEGTKSARRGEIDVLVLFGDRAIILQAKSKRLTIEARKGNDLQIKDDFKKAVQSAYDQSRDCALALLEPDCRLLDRSGKPIKIANAPKKIYPICVVADHYPALAFQARQFLRCEKTDRILPPLVTDVFAIDAMAEMLNSPLHFLSYLDLRARFGEKLMAAHELTLLSYHLKQNLWFSSEHDFILLEEDIGVDLDVAMAVRREGIPGRDTPAGILTRLRDTPVGRLIAELEGQSEPIAIELGLFLLTLTQETIEALNEAIGNFRAYPGRRTKRHDVSIAVGEASSGLTIHSNFLPDDRAEPHLLAHCEVRKYSQKAASWYGVAIRPDDGTIRFCGKVDGLWKPDQRMENLVANMRKPRPVAEVTSKLKATRKVGRNAPCPCGSGEKYKKCCLP